MAIIAIGGYKGSGKDTVGKMMQYMEYMKNRDSAMQRGIAKAKIKGWIPKGKHDWEIVKFADPLKDIVCILINCTREDLENEDFKNTPIGAHFDKYCLKYQESPRMSFGTQYEHIEKLFVTEKEANEYAEQQVKHNLDLVGQPIIEKIIMTPRLMLQLLGTDCGRDIIHPNIWINALFSKYNPDKHNWIITDLRFPNEAEASLARRAVLIRVNRDMKKPKGLQHKSETALDKFDGWHFDVNNTGTYEKLIDRVDYLYKTLKADWI